MCRELFVLINLLSLLILISVPVRCFVLEIEEMSKGLDEFLGDVGRLKKPVEGSERDKEFWQKYAFGTGVGNREELLITNITTMIDPQLLDTIENYQFIERKNEYFLAGSRDYVFHFYKLDIEKSRTIYRTEVNSSRKIQTFKVFHVPDNLHVQPDDISMLFAIICVESEHGTDMLWYRLTGNEFIYFESWPVQNRVESLQYFHHEGQNRLLILREDSLPFNEMFSRIDIYGFNVDGERPNFWVTQRLNVPKTFDIHICPSYENTIIALSCKNEVVIYEYDDDQNEEGLFHEHQNVTSNNLQNADCFESGYIRYLVTSGPEAALFDFYESEFQHDSYTEHIFNEIGEISWIQSMQVNNYREESILLVQLKNSSIIALSWKGRGFRKILLPNLLLENIDFTRATIIPKYGLITGNKLVKIESKLFEKSRPVGHEMEKLLQARYALGEVLKKQEFIIDETEIRVSKSYFGNLTVTGFWNLSSIEVKSLKIERGVSLDELMIGTRKMSLHDFLSDQNEINDTLNDLEAKIDEIKMNLANSVPIHTPEVNLTGDLFIEGNFDIHGTLFVDRLRFNLLNGISRDEIIQDYSNYDQNLIIDGEKIFDSIEVEKLAVSLINNVSMDGIKFSPLEYDYSNIDFSKLTKLKVEGHFNFTTINRINWEELTNKVIFKSESTSIPGITIVDEDLVADNIDIELFNGLSYPEDYIMSMSRGPVVLTGQKIIEKLTTANIVLNKINTINGVSINKYVTLDGERILKEEAFFEDLIITENFRIEGKTIGLSNEHKAARLTLNTTSNMTSDVIITNLTVVGDFEVENSINGTDWFDLDDLVSVDDEEVLITGRKHFLNLVEVDSKLVIEKQLINGHSIDEFMTLDTDQILPNLEKISGNVTFGHIERGDLESMKNLLGKNDEKSDKPTCLAKVIVFKVAPMVDEIFFKVVNNNISSLEFMASTNRTFRNVLFQNLEVTNLRGGEVTPKTVNDENFVEFNKSRITKTYPQVMTGNYEVAILETNFSIVRTIDGFSPKQLENLRISLDNFYDGIANGSVTIEQLTVKGSVRATSVNGDDLKDLYDPETMGKIIFPKDVYVEYLVVDGFINGHNFTHFVEDSVMKTDRDIVVTGEKTFEKVMCESLKTSRINGKSVHRILDPDRHQVISGSVSVNGTINVVNQFETAGEIGAISWQSIRERFSYTENDTYTLNGDAIFTSKNVKIKNLLVTEKIQGVDFNDFLESVVWKINDNITIYGPVIFKNSVTIDSPLTITESYNDFNVKYFYEHAVRVDRPLRVKSKIIFMKDIRIEKDLIINAELKAKSIGGVDLKELYDNAAFIDRPMFIPGSVTLKNVIFESDIEVENLNDIDLNSVITLQGEQTFDRTLNCENITTVKLDIGRTINGIRYDTLYIDTLMLNGNQYIRNYIIFDGNVHCRNNFDATLINGIDATKTIPLHENGTLIGNFIFEHPLVVHGNLHTKGPLNGIDLIKWEATIVTKSFPIRQVVKGDWIIHGNVHFEKNVNGNDFLNGVNVTKFFGDVHKRDTEVELMLEGVKKDLHSFCEDLDILKVAAENQVYKYEYFDLLQIMNFDRRIVSVHQYEWENLDYLFVNFDTCHLDIFVFTGEEFSMVGSLSNVGHIESWLTLNHEEEIYFLTVGKRACDKNPGNLWKLHNDQFIHVDDLGNVTDAKKIKENEFLILVNGTMIHRSLNENDPKSIGSSKRYKVGQNDLKFVINSNRVLLANHENIYEYKFVNGMEQRQLTNRLGTDNILSIRFGIYGREALVYHSKNISKEYLFISDTNLGHHKILQTIEAQSPASVIILNFDGFIENFLIFLENHGTLQIYEYRGIEGFVYRESIRMRATKIIQFKLRKYSKFAKKHCIAAIQDEKLVLMEAKMCGEKLDMRQLRCS